MKVLDVVDSDPDITLWDPFPDIRPNRSYTPTAAWMPRDMAKRRLKLVPASGPRPTDLELQFNEFADAWERETRAQSFVHRRSMHPAYQRIIGLGPPAIGLILERMRRRPGHWFWALNAITGEDPAGGLTKPSVAREAWLQWGRARGYLSSRES